MSIEVDSTMTTRQTIAAFQVIPQYRETQGQGRRKLLTPDEILRLPNTEMLCVIRGCNILKLNKLDYTKHPMAKQMVKCSIMDYYPEPGKEAAPQTEMETEEIVFPRRNDGQEDPQELLQRTAPAEMISELGTGKTVSDRRMDTETVTKRQIFQTDFEQIIKEECEREQKPLANKVPKKKKLYSSAKPPEDF